MAEGIEIRNLSVYYETLEALSMVNMDICSGTLAILLGPNGAGKSTLISAVSGLLYDRIKRAFLTDERIDLTGSIVCEGEEITNLPPSDRIQRGIVHCPERRRLFPEMSVLDNLLVATHLRKDKQVVKEDLEKVFSLFPELLEHGKKEVGFLSGGEQQMVAVGRSLMSKPRFLLMDEPMTGLAPIIRDRIKEVIFTFLKTTSMGILITEQNSKTFLEPEAKIYIIGRGVIVFEGKAEDAMKDEYLSSTYFGT